MRKFLALFLILTLPAIVRAQDVDTAIQRLHVATLEGAAMVDNLAATIAKAEAVRAKLTLTIGAAAKAPVTFGAVMYFHGFRGPDDGLHQMAIFTGYRVHDAGDFGRFYLGAQMVDMQPATDNGIQVKRDQGGLGPTLFWVDQIMWGPRMRDGSPVFFIVVDAGFLDHARIDLETGEFKWGPVWGIAWGTHLSRDSHLLTGVRFHTSYDGFVDTIDLALGIAITDPVEKIVGPLIPGD